MTTKFASTPYLVIYYEYNLSIIEAETEVVEEEEEDEQSPPICTNMYEECTMILSVRTIQNDLSVSHERTRRNGASFKLH